jgi:hypothetical protein
VKPDAGKLLGVTAGHLMTRTAPALPAGYEQASVMGLGALLIAAGEEFERGAARRVEENTELRRLFERAAAVCEDADLGARLDAASAGSDESLRLTDLELSNSALRQLLIELHAHVETLDSDAARSLDRAIWRELAASTERRKLSLAAF